VAETICGSRVATFPGRVKSPRPASEQLVAVALARLGRRAGRVVGDVGTACGAPTLSPLAAAAAAAA
jgi:methylase of polypeptide subunit release factors